VLVGHSYGGMIITAVADRLPTRVRRLVYWNAFVPLDGEALTDLVPPQYAHMFEALRAADGGTMMPFPIWREAFMNDASLAEAESAYARLNPHPWRTLSEPLRLARPPAELPMGKSFLNGTEDIALPHSHGWHPRLSERLGLFRLVQCAGGHELCFTNPALLARKIIEAGRD
jgi:pimeloyl-ACP methyl ester carboxylesterase